MDSLTQIALGAAVGVAAMGRKTAIWKAALWGAIGGTLPDLDVVIDHGNPVLNMVRHRAETHSLFYLSLFAPLLAWVATRVHGEGPHFKRWFLAMWLVLVTHPLLDTMTVYGTQLLMPFTDHPFAVGSIFIIDPAYTLPLIVGAVAAMSLKGGRGLKWNAMALGISSAYLAWGVFAQHKVTAIAQASLPDVQVAPDQLLVTAGPFNSVLWRLVATTQDQYFEGHYSLLDAEPKVVWTAYPRGAEWIAQHASTEAVARIAAFSHGFYKLQLEEAQLMLTDLRMGQEPSYTFRFDLGKPHEVGSVAIQQRSLRPDLATAFPLLWRRIKGLPAAQ